MSCLFAASKLRRARKHPDLVVERRRASSCTGAIYVGCTQVVVVGWRCYCVNRSLGKSGAGRRLHARTEKPGCWRTCSVTVLPPDTSVPLRLPRGRNVGMIVRKECRRPRLRVRMTVMCAPHVCPATKRKRRAERPLGDGARRPAGATSSPLPIPPASRFWSTCARARVPLQSTLRYFPTLKATRDLPCPANPPSPPSDGEKKRLRKGDRFSHPHNLPGFPRLERGAPIRWWRPSTTAHR